MCIMHLCNQTTHHLHRKCQLVAFYAHSFIFFSHYPYSTNHVSFNLKILCTVPLNKATCTLIQTLPAVLAEPSIALRHVCVRFTDLLNTPVDLNRPRTHKWTNTQVELLSLTMFCAKHLQVLRYCVKLEKF